MKVMNVKFEKNVYGTVNAIELTNEDLDKAFNVKKSCDGFNEKIGYDLAEAHPEMDMYQFSDLLVPYLKNGEYSFQELFDCLFCEKVLENSNSKEMMKTSLAKIFFEHLISVYDDKDLAEKVIQNTIDMFFICDGLLPLEEVETFKKAFDTNYKFAKMIKN